MEPTAQTAGEGSDTICPLIKDERSTVPFESFDWPTRKQMKQTSSSCYKTSSLWQNHWLSLRLVKAKRYPNCQSSTHEFGGGVEMIVHWWTNQITPVWNHARDDGGVHVIAQLFILWERKTSVANYYTPYIDRLLMFSLQFPLTYTFTHLSLLRRSPNHYQLCGRNVCSLLY